MKKPKHNWNSYLFILPALCVYLIFGLYPFIRTFQLSFYKWDGIAPAMQFVGLRNYYSIIFDNPVWWTSILNASIVSIIALTFQNGLALLLAIALYHGIKRGRIAYRLIFFMPPMLSLIVVGYIWLWIYDGTYGILNHMLRLIGAGHLARAWLSEPSLALISVAVAHCWRGFGFAFILFLAGLQTIPDELYEAAKVDGAGGWQQFRYVTLPLLIPVAIIVSILTILGTMQIFDLIMAMTQGGPGFHTEVPITRIYKEAFSYYHFGYGTTMAIVFGGILFILSLIQMGIAKKNKI